MTTNRGETMSEHAVDPSTLDPKTWVEVVFPSSDGVRVWRAGDVPPDGGWRIVAVLHRADECPPAEQWDMRGGSLWLDREQWGVIIDALIQHRGHADDRKAVNSESTSDVRADMCADLIRKISTAADGGAVSAPDPAEPQAARLREHKPAPIRERLAALVEQTLAERDEARAALARVEALHYEDHDAPWLTLSCKCGEAWPCSTIAALRTPDGGSDD